MRNETENREVLNFFIIFLVSLSCLVLIFHVVPRVYPVLCHSFFLLPFRGKFWKQVSTRERMFRKST